MAATFNFDRPFPESAQRDIAFVVSNAGRLVSAVFPFSAGVPQFTPTPVLDQIAAELSVSYADVRRMFSALETLADIQRSVGGPEQVVTLLERRLSPEGVAAITENRDDVIKLLSLYSNDHPVSISIKAEKLGYLHENLYQDGEIITDSRPVFNSDGIKLVEFIITHSLVLNHYSYGSATGKRTHFAMDSIDVVRLREACDRAIKKASILKEALGEKWPVKILNDPDVDDA